MITEVRAVGSAPGLPVHDFSGLQPGALRVRVFQRLRQRVDSEYGHHRLGRTVMQFQPDRGDDTQGSFTAGEQPGEVETRIVLASPLMRRTIVPSIRTALTPCTDRGSSCTDTPGCRRRWSLLFRRWLPNPARRGPS